MIVFAAGVPRSGTVLVSAIIRALFAHAGQPVTLENPHSAELPALLEQLAAHPPAMPHVTLIHTHSWGARTARLVAATDRVTGFLNRRDPRDICVSLMRLHDHDFATAAPLVVQYFKMFGAACRDTGWPVIDYAALTDDTPAHIRGIAGRLGLRPDAEAVAQIAEDTSVARHGAIMAQVQRGEVTRLTQRRNSRRILREDADTLINDRHIQSGQTGRWQTELTSDQKRQADVLFAGLIPPTRNG